MKLFSQAEKAHARMVVRDLKRMLAFALMILVSPLPALAQVGTESHVADTVRIGRGTAVNKTIEIRNSSNSATNPKIRWNNALSRLEFTNNGSLYKAIGSGSGGAGGVELLSNPGFEDGSAVGWTSSGGTYTEVTAGSNLLFGDKSITFDASATSQYFESDSYTIPEGLKGAACLAYIHSKGGDGTNRIKVIDGGGVDILAGSTIYVTGNTGTTIATAVPFTCPSSGTIKLRVESTQDATVAAFDDAHLGSDTGQFQLTQGKVLLQARRITSNQTIATTAATTVVFNSAVYDPYSVLNTSTGVATMKEDGVATVSLNLDQSGVTADTSAQYAYVYKNGVVPEGCAVTYVPGNTRGMLPLSACSFPVVAGDAITVRVASDSDSSYDILGAPSTNWNISLSPSLPQSGRRYNTTGWRVDATISGANPSLGVADQASYTEITDAGLTLTNNPGNANMIAAKITCSSTNAPSGTTCSAGNESVGVAFDLPAPGDVRACANFSWYNQTGSSATNYAIATFQMIETPVNAQTNSQLGKDRIGAQCAANSAAAQTCRHPFKVCGEFSFASSGPKAIRLMYEQNISGTPAFSLLIAEQTAAQGQPDIHITVEPITETKPAPVLSGPFENVTNVTGAYTALPGDSIINLDAAGGAFTMGLPAAASVPGKRYRLAATAGTANFVTIDPSGSELICGQSTVKMSAGSTLDDNMEIYSTGAAWKGLNGACERDLRGTISAISVGSCVAGSENYEWLGTTSPNSAGDCQVAIGSGLFSAAPVCTTQLTFAGDPVRYVASGWVNNVTTALIRIKAATYDETTDTTSEDSGPVHVSCKGPR